MGLNISHALALISNSHKSNHSQRQPTELYDPRNYIMSMGGKKMRSLFCLLGYQAYKPDVETALDIAYALELFHNFTLVHDDIMDDAPLRRGKPSVYAKYGMNEAILSGDVMLIEVYERLIALEQDDILGTVRTFNKVAREVCEGQSMDMAFEQRDEVSIEEYIRMIELKTAVLLGLSLQLGAKTAGASVSDQEHLYRFGCNAGIAFQLQDDYLDVYGDPEKFGKKVGGDIIQGKKTYLYLRAIGLMEGKERDDFITLYSASTEDPSSKVQAVTAIFNELFITNYCEEAKKAFFDLAKSHLDMVNIGIDQKTDLLAFAEQLMNRAS